MEKKKPEKSEDDKDIDEEEAEDEEAEEESDESEEESEEEEEESEDDSESDEEEPSQDEEEDDEDIDVDAELDKERKSKEEKEKARKGYLLRKKKEESDEDKPLTKSELDEILQQDRKERREQDAYNIANSLTKKAKIAKLLVERWKNRTFPEHLTLNEQMEEVYGGTFAKKILGERSEALRALKNKSRVNRDGSFSNQDGKHSTSSPKLPPADLASIKRAGFVWKNSRFEKKLANGNIIVRDPKTKRTTLIRAKSK